MNTLLIMNIKLFPADMLCPANTDAVQMSYEYNIITDQSVLRCTYDTNTVQIQYEYNTITDQFAVYIQCKYKTKNSADTM